VDCNFGKLIVLNWLDCLKQIKNIKIKNAMKHLKLIVTGFILSIIFFVGCNNSENNMIPKNKGRINIQLGDSPYPIHLISSTMVTIDKVEIRKHMVNDMGETQDSFIVINDGEMVVNLLELTNGITEQIGTADLGAGTYDMIRLHVVSATVELKDGSTFDLKVPSGSSSGLKIKINPAIQLAEGQSSDVLLDFDVSRSFVVKGRIGKHINGFNFKPVIRAVYLGAAGRIEGNVSDTTGVPLENAMVQVWVPSTDTATYEDNDSDEGHEKMGIVDDKWGDESESYDNNGHLVSTFSDADGNYKLIGIPEGVYSVICELEGYESDTTDNVSVVAGDSTTVNFKLVMQSNAVAEVFK